MKVILTGEDTWFKMTWVLRYIAGQVLEDDGRSNLNRPTFDWKY
jgi:hypothetical protein